MSVLSRNVRIGFIPAPRPKPDPAIADRQAMEAIVAQFGDNVDRDEAQSEIERLMTALKPHRRQLDQDR
jgi:hypothetical protein